MRIRTPHFMKGHNEGFSFLSPFIADKEKDWELIEIGHPDNGNIPLMFRRRQEAS